MSVTTFNGPLAPHNNIVVSVLAGATTLDYNSPTYQCLDAGGAHRVIHLPACTPEMAGRRFFIKNASDAAENLTVDVVTDAGVQIVDGLVTGGANANGTTVVVAQNQCSWFICTGSTTTGQWVQVGITAWDDTAS